jgi:ribose 5-phosphate isomerase B
MAQESSTITIGLGTDHRGFSLKNWLQESFVFQPKTIVWQDFGAYTAERSDYPEFAKKVSQALLEKKIDYGILLCGSGVGMAIAANRFKGIYAGLVWNAEIARLAKQDDNINILVIPADFVSIHELDAMVRAWLSTEFNNGRYQKRLESIDK